MIMLRILILGVGLFWVGAWAGEIAPPDESAPPVEMTNSQKFKLLKNRPLSKKEKDEWDQTLNMLREEGAALERSEKDAYLFAEVAVSLLKIPAGRWTLIRKGTDICALRITTIHHELYEGKPLAVSVKSGFTNYDWLYQNDGSGDLSKSNVQTGADEAAVKPNLWRFPRGTYVVKCGPLEAGWRYPNLVDLVAKRKYSGYAKNIPSPYESNDLEIALTGWKKITDVNTHDPRLVWHHFDPARDAGRVDEKPILIPVEKLPGGKEN